MRRRAVAFIGLLASGLVLGGCVAFKDVQPSQPEVGGPVRIQLTICATDQVAPIDHAGCTFTTNRPGDAANDDYQALLAFRVPIGASAPQELTSVAGEPLAFTRSPSYEQELTRLQPPPATHFWVGYLSSPYTLAYAGMEPARESTVAATFELPRPAEGGPFHGPFSYLPVVGGREIGDAGEPAAGDPVSCGEGIAGDPVLCIDYPLMDGLGNHFNFFGTRDFGIVAGNATASPGQSVTLPFNVRGAGAIPAGATATIAASTSLPGAGATPSVGSAPLANGSDTRVTVPVAIPPDAAAGTYEVALTARLENGQERRGVGQLTVRPRPAVAPNRDTTKPALSKTAVKPKRFKAATRKRPRRGTDVKFVLSEAASVRLTVERCAKRAGKRKRGRCVRFKALKGAVVRQGRAGANELRFDGRLRGKALKPGAYRLVVTPTDAAGNRGPAARLGFAIAR